MSKKLKLILELTLMYVVIGFSGWLCYDLLSNQEPISRLFYADLVMCVSTFIISLIKRNSSVYDAYWSVIPFFFIVHWFVYFEGLEWDIHKWICAISVSAWSWRLTFSWIRGFPGWHHEDWRYVNFRKQFGKFFQPINFLAIHLYPTIVVFLGILPLFWIYNFGDFQSHFLFWIGALLSFLGTTFEYVADNQLATFRNRRNKKKEEILNSGIWAYSRNPNYLGEILFWFGLLGMGIAYSAPWYTAGGAVAIFLMIVFASIPMKEKRMMKNRPVGFKKYKNEVSVLLPLHSKK